MKLWELLEARDKAGQAYYEAKRALEEVTASERGTIYAWYRGNNEREQILFVGSEQDCLDWVSDWKNHELHQYDGIVIVPTKIQADPNTYAPREHIAARLYVCLPNTPSYAAALAWLKKNE